MTIQEMQLTNPKITQSQVGMSATVMALRENLLNTMPSVCVERARLVTEAYKAHEFSPTVLRRAYALAHVLENMTIYIQPGEIIVGNQASAPRLSSRSIPPIGLVLKLTSSFTVQLINSQSARR